MPDLAAALAGRRAHQHRRVLELALGVVASGAESGLEVDFHQDVLMAHGLPAMAMAVPDESGSLRRDFECEADHLVVEIDGRIGHGDAEARPRQPTRPQGRTHRPGAGA